MLGAIDAASVAVVTLRFAAADVALPEEGTGILVPGGTRRTATAPHLVTAVTFLDRKWPPPRARRRDAAARVGRPHRRRPVRKSSTTTRSSQQVTDELAALLRCTGAPLEALVTRWPDAFPQYRVNHLVRVEGIEAAAAALGGVAVAGAAYRGVGVPACIASGRARGPRRADVARRSVVVPGVHVEAGHARPTGTCRGSSGRPPCASSRTKPSSRSSSTTSRLNDDGGRVLLASAA